MSEDQTELLTEDPGVTEHRFAPFSAGYKQLHNEVYDRFSSLSFAENILTYSIIRSLQSCAPIWIPCVTGGKLEKHFVADVQVSMSVPHHGDTGRMNPELLRAYITVRVDQLEPRAKCKTLKFEIFITNGMNNEGQKSAIVFQRMDEIVKSAVDRIIRTFPQLMLEGMS